ncbi:MAG: hypothetical protein AAF483_23195 [Planctomycetota bacterium]
MFWLRLTEVMAGDEDGKQCYETVELDDCMGRNLVASGFVASGTFLAF